MQKCISIKLFCNFIEIALLHGCSPVNVLHVFRTPNYKNTLSEFQRKCRSDSRTEKDLKNEMIREQLLLLYGCGILITVWLWKEILVSSHKQQLQNSFFIYCS